MNRQRWLSIILAMGLDPVLKPAKRPGWAQSNLPRGPTQWSGLHPSSTTGQCQCVAGAADSISAARVVMPMAGRVNSGNGNSHGGMPSVGRVNGLGGSNPEEMPTAGVVNRLSGSTSSGNISREMPVDGKDIGHSGKATGSSGSTREGRPTAGMVNGLSGRIGGVMPTGGMVSSSKANSLPRVNFIIPDILMPA